MVEKDFRNLSPHFSVKPRIRTLRRFALAECANRKIGLSAYTILDFSDEIAQLRSEIIAGP